MGYLGLSDATAVAYGTPLSYEGTSPIDSTHTPTAVLNGQYPIFSEEHMYYLSAGTFALNSTLLSLAQSIGTQITKLKERFGPLPMAEECYGQAKVPFDRYP